MEVAGMASLFVVVINQTDNRTVKLRSANVDGCCLALGTRSLCGVECAYVLPEHESSRKYFYKKQAQLKK